MNETVSTTYGTRILKDNEKPHLRIDFGRTDTGAIIVDLTTPPIAREEPIRVTLNGATIAQRNIPAAAKPCGCPDSSESVLGGVHVRHREDCLHGEPRRYIWRSAGCLCTGNLADYACHWENLDPEVQHATKTDELRTWTDVYRLTVTCDVDDHFWCHYRPVGDEWVNVDIDGQ